MRLPRLLLTAFTVALLLGTPTDSALATQTVKLDVAMHPERLGEPTTVSFGFRISTIGGLPVPLTSVGVLTPSEMGIATSGLGLENCVPFDLEDLGPKGCPANSLMGTGIATAKVPIGNETVFGERADRNLFGSCRRRSPRAAGVRRRDVAGQRPARLSREDPSRPGTLR